VQTQGSCQKLNERYEPVIGLEVHAQMLTETKAFCGCSSKFGDEPNTNVCPVCLGMPGSLPVLNRRLVDFILRMGLSVNCHIASRSIFARKNYFYPDLPKGYQISQFEEPICTDGWLDIELDDGSHKRIGIKRIHMEEDAGKSIHDIDVDTLIDLNRCGVPLIEVVTEPDIRTPHEAHLCLSGIRQLVTYLGICDGNMEEGSLRCDANVSVRRKGEMTMGTKTEVKNMNSFRHVERALEYEITRQIELLEDGERIVQETLLWDAALNVATPMRSKEEAHDYRYFPDPDLVPVLVDERHINEIRGQLPELPKERRNRFVSELGLPRYDADVLTGEKGIADYVEDVLSDLTIYRPGSDKKELAKSVSNWVMTDVLRVLSEKKIAIDAFPVSHGHLAAMIGLIHEGKISGKIAKEIFEEMLVTRDHPNAIVERKDLLQVSDSSVIQQVVDQVLAANKAQVENYVKGNEKVFGYFVGEAMKAMKGKANPKLVNDVLKHTLNALKG
jgi:aspartyl-tRNA(Asn)/glutamyl-tRNA(Gln) amidotransferase subunit B